MTYRDPVAVAPTPCNAVIPGDVNGDGNVDGKDLQDFTRVILNPGGATQQELCASDLFVDGLAEQSRHSRDGRRVDDPSLREWSVVFSLK